MRTRSEETGFAISRSRGEKGRKDIPLVGGGGARENTSRAAGESAIRITAAFPRETERRERDRERQRETKRDREREREREGKRTTYIERVPR